jgi:hypothetical protein
MTYQHKTLLSFTLIGTKATRYHAEEPGKQAIRTETL